MSRLKSNKDKAVDDLIKDIVVKLKDAKLPEKHLGSMAY